MSSSRLTGYHSPKFLTSFATKYLPKGPALVARQLAGPQIYDNPACACNLCPDSPAQPPLSPRVDPEALLAVEKKHSLTRFHSLSPSRFEPLLRLATLTAPTRSEFSSSRPQSFDLVALRERKPDSARHLVDRFAPETRPPGTPTDPTLRHHETLDVTPAEPDPDHPCPPFL